MCWNNAEVQNQIVAKTFNRQYRKQPKQPFSYNRSYLTKNWQVYQLSNEPTWSRLIIQEDLWKWICRCSCYKCNQISVVGHSLSAPHSYVKTDLHSKLLMHWQDHWRYSDKERYTFDLVPVVYLVLSLLSSSVTAFKTGGRPFKEYLHKSHCSDSSAFECGASATTLPYYYYHPLTSLWNLRRPLSTSKNCLNNIFTHLPLLSKVK